MSIVRTLRAALGPHLLTPLRTFTASPRLQGLEEFIGEPIKEGEKVTAGCSSHCSCPVALPIYLSSRSPEKRFTAETGAGNAVNARYYWAVQSVVMCPVVTGRSWSAEDLRRKSWDDLHKLWYVLLKERNLLLSERDRYRAVGQIMPNGRRMTKVSRTLAQAGAAIEDANGANACRMHFVGLLWSCQLSFLHCRHCTVTPRRQSA